MDATSMASVWATVALVLVFWSVARLFTMWRVLHLCLIAGVPILLFGLVAWAVWKYNQHRKAAEASHSSSPPPIYPATGSGPAFDYSARAPHPYDRAPYVCGSRLVFGPESTGIAPRILRDNSDACYGIPLWGGVRSLNLSTTVGIVVYEAYRQLGAWDAGGLAS